VVVARSSGAVRHLAARDLANRPGWYSKWVIPEGYGILEFSQFVTMLAALFIAVRLLFKPFVRKRPFVFAVTIISALSCLYIAGEEMSWGQHFFHWKTPEYWAMVNRQEETNLHNIYPDLPRFRAMATGGSRDWRRDRRHHRADCRSLLPAHPRQPAVAVPATGSFIAYGGHRHAVQAHRHSQSKRIYPRVGSQTKRGGRALPVLFRSCVSAYFHAAHCGTRNQRRRRSDNPFVSNGPAYYRGTALAHPRWRAC
jgi:hypothetical protein